MDLRDARSRPRPARSALFAALSALLLALPSPALSQGASATDGDAQRWTLELTVDGAAADWSADAPAAREGDALVVPAGAERAVVRFAGGWLDLNVADLGAWNEAHVVGVAARPGDGSWRFDATVRHADEGWDHYADLWRVVPAGNAGSVENGVRELLHPHETEQPFTRSQNGVRLVGPVLVEARDSVHGFGGSRIGLEPTDPPAAREVRWSASRTE